MQEAKDHLTAFVRGILERMGVPADVAVTDNGDGSVAMAVRAEQDSNLLIGKDGGNLRALEQVARAAWSRRVNGPGSLVLDVNDYRGQQLKEMVARVHEAARRVRDTRRSESLEPMTSYERRVVHTELASYHDLATESIGVEPRRRVVIKPL